MHDYVHSEAALQAQEGGDLKRRRVEEWQPYGIAGRPPTQATVTTMTGRRVSLLIFKDVVEISGQITDESLSRMGVFHFDGLF